VLSLSLLQPYYDFTPRNRWERETDFLLITLFIPSLYQSASDKHTEIQTQPISLILLLAKTFTSTTRNAPPSTIINVNTSHPRYLNGGVRYKMVTAPNVFFNIFRYQVTFRSKEVSSILNNLSQSAYIKWLISLYCLAGDIFIFLIQQQQQREQTTVT